MTIGSGYYMRNSVAKLEQCVRCKAWRDVKGMQLVRTIAGVVRQCRKCPQ